jgi:hypothetical protein
LKIDKKIINSRLEKLKLILNKIYDKKDEERKGTIQV